MGNMQGQPDVDSALPSAVGPQRRGRWAASVCVIVAVASAAIMLLGDWTVDDQLRWVFLALIPVSGIVGVVLSVRNLGRGDADQRLDRVTLILNSFVVIAVIPLLWAVVVIVSGP